jgi:hypothetical protein
MPSTDATPPDRPHAPDLTAADPPADAVPPEDEHVDDDPMSRPVGAGIDFTDPNSPLAPLYMTTTGVLATVALAALTLLYSLLPLQHTDVWGHLKLGGWIVENRQLPAHEPYSPYTVKDDSEATFQPWLSQVLYHATFRAGERFGGSDPWKRFQGGAELLRALHVVAIVSVYGLLWLAFRRMSGSGSLALLGLAGQFFAAVSTVGVQRPQVFSLALFAAILMVLSRPVLTRRAVVLVPLLLTLWANLHGGFVVGCGVLALVWLGRCIECGSIRAAVADAQVRRLLLAGVLAAAAVAVLNPTGPRIYLLAAGFGNNPNLAVLQEWQPVDFLTAGTGSRLYVATLAVTLVTVALSPLRVTPAHYLLGLTFGVAPLLQQRMMTWWCPLALWLLMPHWGAIAGRWGLVWPASTPSLRKTLLAVLATVPFVMLSPPMNWLQTGTLPPPPVTFRGGTPIDLLGAVANPVAPGPERMKPLAAALRERYAGRPVGPLFTSEALGELAYWRAVPGCPPVWFTHAHLFPPAHWLAAFNAARGGPGWWEFLDRHRANLIAVEPDFHPELVAAATAHPDWLVVLDETNSEAIRDPRARLFVAVRKQPLPLPEVVR